MSNKMSIGDKEYLKKRTPQNPKYQHVKSRLDTGWSMTKYLERLEDIKKNYRYKKDELFKRLKVTTFAQLVIQVASVSDLHESIMDEVRLDDEASELVETDRLSDQTDGSPQPAKTVDGNESNDMFSPRSTLQRTSSSVPPDQCNQTPPSIPTIPPTETRQGELDLDKDGQKNTVSPIPVCTPSPEDQPYPDCPYLLLDVRDRDSYDQCHIISAHSFPITTLSRTMNPYTKQVLDYKNSAGKIIILYDEDERIASQAATTMCERGFENLFMLSGGLKVMAQKFPEGMTTGSFPVACLPSGSSGGKNSTFRQLKRPAEKKCRFTSEDLNNIQHYLEEVLIPSEPSSRLSSRMSTSSAHSKASSARSSRLGSASARSQSSQPWK